MEGLDLTIAEEILLMRSSRTATFTLSSSSSSSSLCSNLFHHQNGQTTTTTTTTTTTMYSTSYISEHHSYRHSQSLIFDNQRRRPTIHDPYQLAPNLQILDDWMIVSQFVFVFVFLFPAIDFRNIIYYMINLNLSSRRFI